MGIESSRRRWIVAVLLGLLSLTTLGGLAGLVTAAVPSEEVPGEFGVPPIHVGDRGEYGVSVVRRTGSGVETIRPELPSVRFEWLSPRDLLDDQGIPRRANVVWEHWRMFAARGADGSIGIQNGALDKQGKQHSLVFDAATWRMIGWDNSLLAVGSTFSQQLLCGLRNELQGTAVAKSEDVRLFLDCGIETRLSVDEEFRAVTREAIDGRTCVKYARVPSIRSLTTDNVEMYAWMCADLPYPARMAVEDKERSDEFVVYRLASFARGTTGLAAGNEPPTIHAPPPIEWKARHDAGLDETGLNLAFPASAAFAYAKSDPTAPALRSFLSANADAFVAHADYAENQFEGTVSRYWWFALNAGGDQVLYLGVVRTGSAPGEYEYRYANFTELMRERFDGALDLAAPYLAPADLPDLRSLDAWWRAYRHSSPPDGQVGWGFSVTPNHPWCRNETKDCVANVRAWVGVALSHSPQFPQKPPFALGAEQSNTLGVNLVPASREFHVSGVGGSGTPFVWRAASSQGVAALTSIAEVPAWNLPSGGVILGATAVSLLLTFSVGAWPAVKSGALLGLFSRVDRHGALEAPARVHLLSLIEANPGIHFQAIRRETRWSNGRTRHHLQKLVDVGILTEVTAPGYTCYFPQGRVDRSLLKAAPVLKAPGAKELLRVLVDSPGSSFLDLAGKTHLTSATVQYHAQRFAATGLVEIDKRGREASVRPTDLGRQARDLLLADVVVPAA